MVKLFCVLCKSRFVIQGCNEKENEKIAASRLNDKIAMRLKSAGRSLVYLKENLLKSADDAIAYR